MAGKGSNITYVHHPEGYSKLSLLQQNTLKSVTPHVAAAARSVKENRDDPSFVVVDYGAADGINSVPMIAACLGELSSKVNEFEWMFNDSTNFDYNTHTIEDRLKQLPGWKEGSVKVHYLVGNFYHQVIPDESVNLGVSVTALHWLSRRPPKGCCIDPRYPDEATTALSAMDWLDFLQCRAKELKQDGRLVIGVPTAGNNSPVVATDKDYIVVAPQQVITDMFNEGIITKEEYEFAQVFPASLRTESDLQAPFLDPKSELSRTLHLVDIKTYHVSCPFYHKWMKAGGREKTAATEELVTEHVNFTKSFYNTLWKILEVTRSRAVHLAILDTFYKEVEDMVRGNLEGYHAASSITVLDIMKI